VQSQQLSRGSIRQQAAVLGGHWRGTMAATEHGNCPTGQDDCQGEAFCISTHEKLLGVDRSGGFVRGSKPAPLSSVFVDGPAMREVLLGALSNSSRSTSVSLSPTFVVYLAPPPSYGSR
jgi:hypothetical protein